MGTNAAIAILAAAMIRLVGFCPFLLVHLPITVLAASIGVWLFYVQHQFEDTCWSRDEAWSFHEAALHVRTITCRPSCAGSRPTSASITSITYAVEFLVTGCRMCCGIIRRLLPSDELLCAIV